jgi:2,3-dihydroxybenzoate-AMP ligase
VTPGIKEDPTMREGFVPWPKEAADRYREAGYWRGRPLGSYLHEWAETYGDAVAVVDGDTRLTYRQLVNRADGLACRLLDSGLNPGDAMLVQLPNGWEFVTLTLACLRAGIAPVMALPAHRGHELRYLAAHAEVTSIAVPDRLGDFDHQALGLEVAEATPSVRLLLVAGGTAGTDGATDLRALAEPADDPAAARARLDRIAPDSGDIAVFLLSGGTTGLPKLITRTHDDYEYNARRSAEVCRLDSGTAYLVSLPAGHNFPLACPGILGTLMTGGRVVLARTPDPDKVLPLMAAEGVTVTAAVPAVVQRWIDAVASGRHLAPPALRLLQVGGARLAPEVARRAEPVLGGTLQQVFGMAEGLLNYTRPDDPDAVKIETQGRPMCADDEILVVDASDNLVPPGEMGALLTRGPYTPRGYYRADEHNARAFTPDGWYRTGDVVRLHPSGNLVVEGRDKDMINRGGEKISAEEVENLIYRLPGVAQVAAVAKPDPDLGERVCAVVVVEPGTDLTLDSVRGALTAMQVARYKLPEDLLVLDELPLTKVGKIDKKRLRDVVRDKADSVEEV